MSFLLAFFLQFSWAENWKDPSGRTVTVRTGFASGDLGMEISDKNKIGKNIRLKPNSPTRLFLGLSYKWMGLSVSSALPVSEENTRMRGETKTNDWQFRFNFKQWILEGVYQQYKGYYLENSGEFNVLPGSPSIFYPDLVTEHTGAIISYVTRPESFSMSAAFDQSSQQVDSGWSLIYSIGAHNHRFATPTSLVPTMATGTYGDFERVRGARLYSVNVGIGIAGTYVIYGPWFLTGVFGAGLGAENQDVERTDMNTSNNTQTSSYQIKLGLGYNGDDWIFGLGVHSDGTTYGIENANVALSTTANGILVGTRFRF